MGPNYLPGKKEDLFLKSIQVPRRFFFYFVHVKETMMIKPKITFLHFEPKLPCG